MTDDFIRKLQEDWRAQPVERADVVGRLKRGRWTPRVLLWLELLQGAVAVICGVVFVWAAFDGALLAQLFEPALSRLSTERAAAQLNTMRAIFGVSGVVMFAAMPLVWAAVRARWGSLKWEDETPESVLRVGLRRADASLRANKVGRWHVWLLVAFVAALWALPPLGLAPTYLVIMLTLIYAACIVPIWLWLDLRWERVRGELETYLKLLEQYRTPEG